MAELDYVFLADHAQVMDGKLSSIGASFTNVTAASTEGLFMLSVAGRVRTTMGAANPELGIRLRGPGGMFEVSNATELFVGPQARPYGDGKVGILFAANLAVPIVVGLYEVFVSLDGEEVRRLAFDITLAE